MRLAAGESASHLAVRLAAGAGARVASSERVSFDGSDGVSGERRARPRGAHLKTKTNIVAVGAVVVVVVVVGHLSKLTV